METVIETAPAAPSMANARPSVVRRARSAIRAAWVHLDVRHHDDEFLPAQPAEEVAAADDLLQLSSEALEHQIADVMTVGVVHPLEMIDVENHHRQGRGAPARGFDHRGKAALERAAIAEAGQRVVKRHLDRLLHRLAQPVGVAFLAQVRAHPRQKLVPVDRAGEVVVDPEFEAAQNLGTSSGSAMSRIGRLRSRSRDRA